MKAILRSYNPNAEYTDQDIEVDDDYEDWKGPYHPDNENKCPVVGSNQQIIVPE